MIALIGVASLVVILGTLMALGVIDMSKFRSNEPSTAGLIAVPTPATVIPAYTRIRRDHLWDRRNARLAVIYLPPAAVTKEMLVNIGDIIGRVLDGNKEPGYVFTESDFLPKGTREGIVAGIPAGKRAIRVSADRVDGLYGLHAGDRFDILATMPIDAAGGGRTFNFAGPYSQEMALQAQLSNWDKQATVRVIVQSALIVEPMTSRGVQTIQSSLTEGNAARTRQVQETVIAIEPDEVALLTEAMAVNAKLTTIPRSGRPDDPLNSKTPDLRPFSPFNTTRGGAPGTGSRLSDDEEDNFRVVETISGQKRTLTAVPRP
jgi:Flp pilus assembly protein CpaB